MSRDQLKQALISVAIGAIVAFITTLLQGILDVLHANMDSIVGAAAAGFYHFARWKTTPIA